MSSDTSEKRFQNDIIDHLMSTGYMKRNTHRDYNKASCLDPELTLKFIHDTQEKTWKKWQRIYGEKAEQKFFFRLVSEIDRKGTIHVLRNGFKDASCNFKLFYPQPNNNKNPDSFMNFKSNIFSVIDELEYQEKDNGNRIDLVIFINGLPIVTIELKDTFAQGVENAIKQYREDRDPREKIFKRCFVHFAMSDEKIAMATKLEGRKTRFLPFNKGLENPVVKGDYKTCYLYNDILQINKLSKLISNFIYIEKDKKKELPIFPRYHQLDCVNRVLGNTVPGKNYLIEHSAGSGKTKTIAWLAHGLIKKFNSRDERFYDMVVVVSDRRVIDQQLQAQVKAIEKVKGIVEVIDDNSDQLGEALKTGSNIVVTTLHKFSYILEKARDLPKRNYAVIIDEAHSSQTGNMARNMKKVLSTNSLEEAELLDDVDDDVEEEILREIESFRNLNNISFFAFTATPKNKTLEMFGTENEVGEYLPFHTYTMKQAIEEGFILDVLKHYLSYETYFKLIRTVEDDPEFEEQKAKRLLRNFVEKHPHAISKKTEIMLDHFMNSTRNKIKGKARAMVVTRSRLHAVLYKKEFDKAIEKNGYSIKTLVAFTGTVKHDEKEYTENSMNDISRTKSIENAFVEDPYRILIVANKYQTGFDQPLLHTMYVDKSLNGIAAVQTLSRANRIYENKNDTLILDFANQTDVIQKAFEPFYEVTYLKEATDPHKLYELQDKLLDYHVFDEEDIDTFVNAYKKGENQQELHNILSPVVKEFKKIEKEDQVGFKKTLRRYQNIYSFLSQLIPFSDVKLEKLYIFNKFLNKKLPTINDPLPFNVLEDVDMDSYKIADKGESVIPLTGNGELQSASDGAANYTEDELEKLSQIIKDLNDAFNTDFTDDDKVFLERVKDNLLDNPELIEKMEHNSKENVEAVFDKYFNREMTGLLNSNMALFKRVNDNDELRDKLRYALFDLIYEDFGNKNKE
ncbi:type I restriction endonuclease subunit R [Methanobacterium aggregans]|uniref:type I restriction endonuclease subunit R n=1 Tax=Methanobacterium aggregans TaxID=1615586 RepID=UPI001AEA36F6|nr:type I restriction endonuclease [Methanobacterium aggregans]MBP2044869.1 type I restriction enzyme R subunit [Methanobacterium aggregans]